MSIIIILIIIIMIMKKKLIKKMLDIVILQIDCQNQFIVIISFTKNNHRYYKNIYHNHFLRISVEN